MPKLKNTDELRKLIKELKEKKDKESIYLKVALGTCGVSSGAEDTYNELLKIIQEKKLSNVKVIKTGCLGYCYAEPTVEIDEPGKKPILYGNVTEKKVNDLVKTHLIEGKILEDLVIKETHKNALQLEGR
nr:(2Fe-2S) ferredoxin domain-containing protein [Petrotoga sp. 9PWA.NaAc.5.4]